VVKSGTIEALLGYDDCELEVEVDEGIVVLWAALGREELPTTLGSDEEAVGVSELEMYPDELWEALGSDDDCAADDVVGLSELETYPEELWAALGSDDDCAADDDVPCELVVLWAALDDVEPSDDEAVGLSEDSDELWTAELAAAEVEVLEERYWELELAPPSVEEEGLEENVWDWKEELDELAPEETVDDELAPVG
jgi:hypothetical protein